MPPETAKSRAGMAARGRGHGEEVTGWADDPGQFFFFVFGAEGLDRDRTRCDRRRYHAHRKGGTSRHERNRSERNQSVISLSLWLGRSGEKVTATNNAIADAIRTQWLKTL